jgi:predicted nucleic acid-binding protein
VPALDANVLVRYLVHVALAIQAGQQPLWTFDKATTKLDGAALLA